MYHLAGTHGPTFYSGDTGNPKSRAQWSNTIANIDGTLPVRFGYGLQNTCLQALTSGGGAAGTYYVDQLAAGVIPPQRVAVSPSTLR